MNDKALSDTPVIVFVDRTPDIYDLMAGVEYPVRYAQTIDDTLQQFKTTGTELVLLDSTANCATLRRQIDAPILMIHEDIDASLEAGADDCVSKHPKLIQRRIDSLIRANNFATFDRVPAVANTLTREQKQLLEESEQRRKLAEALLDTANALNESPDVDSVLDTIINSISRIIPADSSNIMLIENEVARIIRHRGYVENGFETEDISAIRLPLGKAGNLQWVVDNKKALRVDDTHNSDIFRWVDSTTSNYVLSLLTAPIITDSIVIGFINVDSTQLKHFREEQENQLMAFANQAAIAMQHANLIEQFRDYTEQLEKRVSERTQALESARQQLADEKNLLRLIIDTIPESIYVKDRESRFIMANKTSVEHKQGIKDEAGVVGKTDYDFYPDVADHIFKEEQHIIKSGEPLINHHESYYKPDGIVAHVLVTKLPLIDSEGKIRGIIGINHDITRVVQAETRLNQIIKSARCLLWSAIVTIDEDTGIPSWQYEIVNEEAAQVVLPLEIQNRTYTDAWVAATPATEQARRTELFLNQLDSGSNTCHLEYYMSPDSDNRIWLSEEFTFEEITNKRWSVVGVGVDISSRKSVEDVLHELNEKLEQRVEARTLELREANKALLEEVEKSQQLESTERQQRIIAEALRDGVAKLATTLDRDTIFDHLLIILKSIIPHNASNIMLIEGDHVRIVHAFGYDRDIIELRYEVAKMPDVMQIVKERQPHIINDIQQYDHWQEANSRVRSNMSIPISLENEVIGLVNLDSYEPNKFSPEHSHWLISFGEQVGLAIRNARYTAGLEERVKERTRELEFEQAQLKAIVDGVADGIIYTDMTRKTKYANRALAEISGFSEEEWISGEAQQHANTQTETELNDQWERILHWLETHRVWTGETELKHKNGQLFNVKLTRTNVKNQDNQAVGVITVVHDISDEKRLEEQKARFITTAAHELRTPIANLKTRLFLMKRAPERFMEHITVAESVLKLMQNLVEHMFDLSRFERGIIEVKKEPVRISEFLQEVIQFQSPHAERLDVTLKLDIPDESLIIDADPFRLTQVINNLISNALKHISTQQEITLRVLALEDAILLDVIDTGKGIPAEHLPNLFQPFYQVSSDKKGAGLGLAIVQEIVKAHGGDITVESTVGKGTTFHIRLPFAETGTETV